MVDGISVDVSSFSKFARDLNRLAPEVNKQLKAELKRAGEVVATDARARAVGIHGVPSRIKVRRAGLTIRVVVLDQPKPHAGIGTAFEHHGLPGPFRHPVWGHRDRWVAQSSQPFLKPALLAHRHAAVQAAERALHDAFRHVGIG